MKKFCRKRLRPHSTHLPRRPFESNTSPQYRNRKFKPKNRQSKFNISRKQFPSKNLLRKLSPNHWKRPSLLKRPLDPLVTTSRSLRWTCLTKNRLHGRNKKRLPKNQGRQQSRKSYTLSPSRAGVSKRANRRSSKAKTSTCRRTFGKTSK